MPVSACAPWLQILPISQCIQAVGAASQSSTIELCTVRTPMQVPVCTTAQQSKHYRHRPDDVLSCCCEPVLDIARLAAPRPQLEYKMSASRDCLKHHQLEPRQDIGAATHGWVGHLSAREITTLVPPRSMAASACVLRPTLFIEHLMFSRSPVPAPACSCMCEKISQWYLSAQVPPTASPQPRTLHCRGSLPLCRRWRPIAKPLNSIAESPVSSTTSQS